MNLQAYTCKSRLYNIIYCFWIWILNIYYYYYIVIVILLLSILQGVQKRDPHWYGHNLSKILKSWNKCWGILGKLNMNST